MNRPSRPTRVHALLVAPLLAAVVLLGGAALVPASASSVSSVVSTDNYVPSPGDPTPSNPGDGGVGNENDGNGDGGVGNENDANGLLPDTGAEYGLWAIVIAALLALLGAVLVRRSRSASH